MIILTCSLPWNRQWREIENKTLPDKRDDFTFLIVNFPLISNIIPTATAYGVYISQAMRYSKSCASYSEFPNKADARATQTRLRCS